MSTINDGGPAWPRLLCTQAQILSRQQGALKWDGTADTRHLKLLSSGPMT